MLLYTRFGKQEGEAKLLEKKLLAALDVVNYLQENHREVGIFRYPGREETRKKILGHLERGDKLGLEALLKPGVEMESSAALSIFLKNLMEPLIPWRVQKLISAENEVPDEIVAIDALGLLYQELSGIRLTLVIKIFELFSQLNRSNHRSELTSISLAVILLPVLLDIKVWAARWKEVALILHEIIIQSDRWKPAKLETKEEKRNNDEVVQNN